MDDHYLPCSVPQPSREQTTHLRAELSRFSVYEIKLLQMFLQ